MGVFVCVCVWKSIESDTLIHFNEMRTFIGITERKPNLCNNYSKSNWINLRGIFCLFEIWFDINFIFFFQQQFHNGHKVILSIRNVLLGYWYRSGPSVWFPAILQKLNLNAVFLSFVCHSQIEVGWWLICCIRFVIISSHFDVIDGKLQTNVLNDQIQWRLSIFRNGTVSGETTSTDIEQKWMRSSEYETEFIFIRYLLCECFNIVWPFTKAN